MSLFIKWFCFYNEIAALFESMKDMSYAVIKGDLLSLQAYGALGKRNYSDIDILVSLDALSDFEDVLKRFGFESKKKSRATRITLVSNSHQIAPLEYQITPWGKVTVDLNFDIFWGEFEGKRIDINDFLSDIIEVDVYGVKVKTLTPIKAFIQLVLHHYKDMNSIFLLATRDCFKYDMFKDVYYLLKNNIEQISIESLYVMSSKYDIIPYVFYVLYYVGKIFNDDIVSEYIEAFRTSQGEELLDYYGLCYKERKVWKCDFKTRLESKNLYSVIKDDLNNDDLRKISINKRIFLGDSQ